MSSSNSTASLRSSRVANASSSSRAAANANATAPRSKGVRRSTSISNKAHSNDHHNDQDSGRVRVAVRLRPRNSEDLLDADFADSMELQPELRRLILRKNNWSSESYRFDEVFTDTASQKRVYDVVAKPVVESVLNGYNGTVMAYGQTGTGKTYTVGSLGKDDASERGIMVRALEDIIASSSPDTDSIEISYLQLYMEYIQDLLAPEKNNIPINEDSKTGEVTLPGTEVVKIQNVDHFLQILRIGEANRHAANTKLNTESSRSHAILMVYVRRRAQEKEEDEITSKTKKNTNGQIENCIPMVRKSKLLIVDLAGSERVNKSGSTGHLLEEAKFINLSLTSLGKCINALAENSQHIPTRDSKLTRLLRDSFGGSARTSLIVTIGPSARYYAETASTIMFGQRAMKIVNMVKLKEEFDYESLCRKLENQVDNLTAEVERQEKLRENDKQEFEKQLRQCKESYAEEEKKHFIRSELLEKENVRLNTEMKQLCTESNYHKEEYDLMRDTIAQLEIGLKQSKLFEMENIRLETEIKRICTELNNQKEQHDLMRDKVAQLETCLKQSKQQQLEDSSIEEVLAQTTQEYEKKISSLFTQIEDERHRCEIAEDELAQTKKLLSTCQKSIQQLEKEVTSCKKEFANATLIYERKILELKKQLEEACLRSKVAEQQLESSTTLLKEHKNSMQGQTELEGKMQELSQLHELTLDELESLKLKFNDVSQEKAMLNDELHNVRQQLVDEKKERMAVEAELVKLKKILTESDNNIEEKRPYMVKGSLVQMQDRLLKPNPISRDTLPGQRATISKLCEEVGLPKILELLKSDDPEVQIQAIKVVANLAAEDTYQERIVEEGGLDALLMLLQSSQNTTILRVGSGALANLAMNEINQALIMAKGGAQLLASIALRTDDPQTLRMIAGAIANLCGNEKMHPVLKNHGCLKALLEMVKCGNNDVIAQVARGIANFAKCESREIIQGNKKGRSLLIKEGALAWLIANSDISSASSRRHIELALCHLAQNEDNVDDFISCGALKELIRISIESSREDIRTLAKKSLKLSPRLQAMHVE